MDPNDRAYLDNSCKMLSYAAQYDSFIINSIIELFDSGMVYMVFFSLTVLLIEHTQYKATVPENKAGELVTKLSVTDGDDPHSPAWNAKFTIVGGNPGGLFSVETGPSKQEGIIKTVKVGQYIE